ncbi:hypothetical protein GSY63_14995 [Mucilaginibacter sp. R11]|uniref:Uncharacterized protein n=1 Tax=Mucilaginibacter agri TaxID=2695265 RepID=A0A966DSY3_9SPHI|nr:hypothetical protein [Mucilaginibacter agri]
MNYVTTINNITFRNGYSLDLEHPIKEVLQIDNVIVIILEPPANIIYNYNVFAFSTIGDFLWRIEDVKLYYRGSDDCPYTGSIINNDGELVLFNWCDTAVIINPLTGEVIRTYQTK